MRPGNVLSIAKGCGLPREKLGRKVVMLAERGYIYPALTRAICISRRRWEVDSRTRTPN